MSKRTGIFIAIITVVRTYLSAVLQLHPDEAYYWLLSKHLDLSYFDHPPMVAYFIRLTTIFSDSEFFVRFSALTTSIFLSFLIWKLAEEMFHSENISFWSVVILNVYPITAAGIIITPDVPSFLFFALAIFIFWRIVNLPDKKNALKYWVCLGIVSGLALLSKYTSVLFGLCALVFLLLSKRHRFWLLTGYPYIAGVISLLIFSPVILWNYQHEWVSFKFQWGRGTVGAGSLENVLTFIGGQTVVGGIFLFFVGGIALLSFIVSRNKSKVFLASMSLPIFLFFGWAGYRKVGEMNWTVPAFFALALLTSFFLFENKSQIKSFIAKASITFCAIIVAILYIHIAFGILPIGKINKTWVLMDPTNRFYGWKEFAKEIERISDGRPVIAMEYQSASVILYYTRMRQRVYARTKNFKFWHEDVQKIAGGCVTFDYSTDVVSGSVEKWRFKKVLGHRTFEVKRNDEVIRRFNIYECVDFLGF